MAITLNGTSGITTPDISTTAQSTDITTTGDISAVDLTASGGVYLGGTAAANYLDDYEYGTWTPRLYQNGVEVTSPTNAVGYYVKVGRLLHISGYWYKNASPNNSSGQWSFRNLPYALQTGTLGSVTAGYMAVNTSYSTQVARFQANGADLLDLYGQFASSTWSSGYVEFSFSGTLLTAT